MKEKVNHARALRDFDNSFFVGHGYYRREREVEVESIVRYCVKTCRMDIEGDVIGREDDEVRAMNIRVCTGKKYRGRGKTSRDFKIRFGAVL